MDPDHDEVLAAVVTDHGRFGNYFTARDVATKLNVDRTEGVDHITEAQVTKALDELVEERKLERCFDGVTWGFEDTERWAEVPALYRLVL